jgi:integrase/recombinase XerC
MHPQHKKWLTEYLDSCHQMNKSPHTILNYRADIEAFIEWFEKTQKRTLHKADASVITTYKNFLSSGVHSPTEAEGLVRKFLFLFAKKNESQKDAIVRSPLSVGSRKRHLSSIKNFFEYLIQTNEGLNNLFRFNPVKQKIHGIRLKDKDVQNTKLLSTADWRKVLDVIYRPKDRLMVNLLYHGGLRLSELSELKVSDFHRQTGALKFKRKGGDIHTLFLQQGPKIFELLDIYLRARSSESPHLFAGRNGKSITPRAMYSHLMKIFKKAKVSEGLTPHSFRKACATQLYSKTHDLLLVRDYLNHSDAKITQTYIERRLRDEGSESKTW